MGETKQPTPRKSKLVEAEVVRPNDTRTRTEESLDVLVGQLENAIPQQFSDKHIDRYFDNQAKLYRFIREDHKDQTDLTKDGRNFILRLSIIFGVVLLVLVLAIAILDKQELDKFLGYLFAFLGGTGFGGVGVDILRKKSNKKE